MRSNSDFVDEAAALPLRRWCKGARERACGDPGRRRGVRCDLRAVVEETVISFEELAPPLDPWRLADQLEIPVFPLSEFVAAAPAAFHQPTGLQAYCSCPWTLRSSSLGGPYLSMKPRLNSV